MTTIYAVLQSYGLYEEYTEVILCGYVDEERAAGMVQHLTIIAEKVVKLQSEFNTVLLMKRQSWGLDNVKTVPLNNEQLMQLNDYLHLSMTEWLRQHELDNSDIKLVLRPLEIHETSSLSYRIEPMLLIE